MATGARAAWRVTRTIGCPLRSTLAIVTRVLTPLSPPRRALATRYLTQWGRLWRTPALSQEVTVLYSDRLRRSLARCRARGGRLVLHPVLAVTSARLFREVLCHEAAHLAADLLGAKQPHGPEWQALMRHAGFEPRTRLLAPPQAPRQSTGRVRRRYQHFCPVCQWVRYANRRMTRWRCADCAAAGLEGQLVVLPIAAA